MRVQLHPAFTVLGRLLAGVVVLAMVATFNVAIYWEGGFAPSQYLPFTW
jgi:hypothetical protein